MVTGSGRVGWSRGFESWGFNPRGVIGDAPPGMTDLSEGNPPGIGGLSEENPAGIVGLSCPSIVRAEDDPAEGGRSWLLKLS